MACPPWSVVPFSAAPRSLNPTPASTTTSTALGTPAPGSGPLCRLGRTPRSGHFGAAPQTQPLPRPKPATEGQTRPAPARAGRAPRGRPAIPRARRRALAQFRRGRQPVRDHGAPPRRSRLGADGGVGAPRVDRRRLPPHDEQRRRPRGGP